MIKAKESKKKFPDTILKIKWASTWDTKSLLLDTGSTFSCCNNPKMLTNIRRCKRPINGISNGGVMVTSEEGDLPGFFQSIIIPNRY